jgi:beta-phosphoglucomutase
MLGDALMDTFPATLFDYNGVLIDDEGVHLSAFREVLVPLGISIDEHDYYDRFIGYDDRGAFFAILEEARQEPKASLIAELIEQKRHVYLRLAQQGLIAFEGARELLALRALAGPVCIVSGALRDEITLGLELLSARSLVEHVVAAEDTARGKPDPEGYQVGVRYLETRLEGSVARQALVIEDSLAGVRAAKESGLYCLGVAHTASEKELRTAGADATFPRLADVSAAQLSELYKRAYG